MHKVSSSYSNLEDKDKLFNYKDFTINTALTSGQEYSFNLTGIYPYKHAIMGYTISGVTWLKNIDLGCYDGNNWFMSFENPASKSVTLNTTIRVYYI